MNFNNPELLSAKEGCTGAHHGDGPADLSFLDGKKIVRTGYVPDMREGGLAIDYDDDGVIKRVVFGYNDFGLWIAWQGEPGKENPEDVLKAKVEAAMDVLYEQDLKIKSYPLKRQYAFVDDKENPLLTLTLGELKLMGEDVVRCFSSLPLNAEEINESIVRWAMRY